MMSQAKIFFIIGKTNISKSKTYLSTGNEKLNMVTWFTNIVNLHNVYHFIVTTIFIKCLFVKRNFKGNEHVSDYALKSPDE